MATEERQQDGLVDRPAPVAEPAAGPAPGMGLSPAEASVVGLSSSAGNAAVVGLASGTATPPPNLAALGALARASRSGAGLAPTIPARPPEDEALPAAPDGEDVPDDDGLAAGFGEALQRRARR